MESTWCDIDMLPADFAEEMRDEMSKDFLSHAETKALLKGVEDDEPTLPPLAVQDVLVILKRRSADIWDEIDKLRARNQEIQDTVYLLERVAG